jgi:hypothetical protein
MFAEDLVLFPEIVDRVLLTAIHPPAIARIRN